MHHTHPNKPRAVTRCLAVSRAHVGCFDFQSDATGRTRLSIIYHLLQEVTMLVLPTPKEKAAGATAASGAQQSAPTDNPIVPLLRRITMGFGSFFSTNFLSTPRTAYIAPLWLHSAQPND
jgi:hypothetical protein